jgi:ABC-type sugar transport system substrate-binding protein
VIAKQSRRHSLLSAAAGSVLTALPITARAQTKKPPVVIGWLSTYAEDPTARDLPNFKEALAALGRKEGTDFVIETRWAGGGAQTRMRALAAE